VASCVRRAAIRRSSAPRTAVEVSDGSCTATHTMTVREPSSLSAAKVPLPKHDSLLLKISYTVLPVVYSNTMARRKTSGRNGDPAVRSSL